MTRLASRVVPARDLDKGTLARMFEVFEQYYDDVAYDVFCADLAKKDDVILLVDGKSVVQGFSTMHNLEIHVNGNTIRGLFSGDTVVAKEFWGQRVLGRAFLAYLFKKKARHPFAPYYWFLISKGFKTYLLMANNFEDYYPHVDRETPPEAQAILDGFAAKLYPGEYDPATGLIDFDECHGKVRRGVADITPELLDNPKIAHFQRKNPTWFRGTELCCIARMTWTMPVYYTAKAYAKTMASMRVRARAQVPEKAGAVSPSIARLRVASGESGKSR